MLRFLLAVMLIVFVFCLSFGMPHECQAANQASEAEFHEIGGFRGFLPFRRNVREKLRQDRVAGEVLLGVQPVHVGQTQTLILTQPLLVPHQ